MKKSKTCTTCRYTPNFKATYAIDTIKEMLENPAYWLQRYIGARRWPKITMRGQSPDAPVHMVTMYEWKTL